MISLQHAVDDLFRIAVVEGKSTSTGRLKKLADFCVEQLERRGLRGVDSEAPIPGAGRDKLWDVAWKYGGKYRLGISLKSILKNLGGTVPNRIDDLIGETANAQLSSPEIVIGYIVVFNVEDDSLSARYGMTWSELMHNRLTSLSGRRAPSWATGMIEDFILINVDFGSSSRVLSVSQPLSAFFDGLVEQIALRNPEAIDSPNDR